MRVSTEGTIIPLSAGIQRKTKGGEPERLGRGVGPEFKGGETRGQPVIGAESAPRSHPSPACKRK